MADVFEAQSVAGGSEVLNQIKDEIVEPLKKKLKTDGKTDIKGEKLEHRLGGILCCAVCLDLPRNSIFQVKSSAVLFVHLFLFGPPFPAFLTSILRNWYFWFGGM